MKRVQDKTIRNARMNKVERKRHWKSIGKTAFLMFLGAIIAAGFFASRWVMGVLAETPDLNVNLIVAANSTQIVDADGNVFHETGVNREWVYLHDISPVMIDAILAIEDARFFEHYGVDWTRTLAAQVFNIETFIHGTDGLQGGSTITQQLINQTHLLFEDGQRDVSIERKMQEMLLSFQIERILSKDQILEAYLNYSPFGGGIYGVQAAAQFYFGVNASHLTLSQAATLAGLVQSPNQFRPDWNPHFTEVRRNEVLDMMYRHGYINATLRDLAAAEPITDLLVYYTSTTMEEDEMFIDYVNLVLEEAYNVWGIGAHDGYRIYTYMDPAIQENVFNAFTTNDVVNWPNDHRQGAAIVVETQTGYIRGLAGRDLQRALREDYVPGMERGRVMATDLTRSIGSTSKPIWAYGPAMEFLGWGPGTMLDDDLFAYGNGVLVRNWSREHDGRVTMRQAMAPSWNPPALQAFNAAVNHDADAVHEFITRLGFPEDEARLYESYAIGGNTDGFAPIHLAGAYAAFGNTGIYNEPRSIFRIVAPDGTIYYCPSEVPVAEGQEPAAPFRSERAMSEVTAYLMTDTLRTTVTGDQNRGEYRLATATLANIPDWFIAAKTGTTDLEGARLEHPGLIPGDAVGDVWIAGYTQEYTLAVWVGYESVAVSIETGHFLRDAAGQMPNNLFRGIMGRIEHEEPWRRPERPAGIFEAPFELMGGDQIGVTCSPGAATPGAFERWELFQAGHGPACVSTRFTLPDTPTNFAVSATGTTLEFTWDHIDDLPMSLEEAQSTLSSVRAATQSATHISDALRNPTEGQAAMMVRQIEAIGGTEYVVIGNLASGGTMELGSTTDNYLDVDDLTLSQLAGIASFHVVTRFEEGGQMSEPSNVVQNQNLIDESEFEITIPPMNGWTLVMFQEWRLDNGISATAYLIEQEHSDTVQVGRIIRTNPTGTMEPNEVITLFVSSGPEPATPDDEFPGIPGLPGDDDPDTGGPASRSGITQFMSNFLSQEGVLPRREE
ncbi:MAG: transglycosylase domain-containing protein [Turicibacter sp.]|nr:transglycosylase domain-containing protein [Turicibacter sp.]